MYMDLLLLTQLCVRGLYGGTGLEMQAYVYQFITRVRGYKGIYDNIKSFMFWQKGMVATLTPSKHSPPNLYAYKRVMAN